MSETSDRIKGFIASELMFEDSSTSLSDDTALIGGVLDSLGLMQLVAFLEEEFGVEIDDADITVDHFRSIVDIEKLVEQKKAKVG